MRNGPTVGHSKRRMNNMNLDPVALESETNDLVVLPSMSFDLQELRSVRGIVHYEERMLYFLFKLGHRHTRLTYVTSCPLDPAIVRYYLSFLKEPEDIDSRMTLLSVCDGSLNQTLCQKVLNHPRLVARIRSQVHNHAKKHLLATPTQLCVIRGTLEEVQLARALDIPMLAAKEEKNQSWGSKAGSRSCFEQLGIPYPDGVNRACFTEASLIEAIVALVARHPSVRAGVVKLQEGFSGNGNAILDCSSLQKYMAETVKRNNEVLYQLTLDALNRLDFCSKERRSWTEYRDQMRQMGAIVEVLIQPLRDSNQELMTSPSVQVVMHENQTVEVLSTHEQILDGQRYTGCAFPCRAAYRQDLMEYGARAGRFLAQEGITDHFSIDFVCVENKEGVWSIYAIEINLRLTATTHHWRTLQLLTRGHTDAKTGIFYSPLENAKPVEKAYYASDHVEHPSLRHLLPMDLHEIIEQCPELNWCTRRQTGVIFHMLGGLSEYGKIGMTSIGNDAEEAQSLFHKAWAKVVHEAMIGVV